MNIDEKVKEAKENLKNWRRWAAAVKKRWRFDSPMVDLADRRVQEAEFKVYLYQRVKDQLEAIKVQAKKEWQ